VSYRADRLRERLLRAGVPAETADALLVGYEDNPYAPRTALEEFVATNTDAAILAAYGAGVEPDPLERALTARDAYREANFIPRRLSPEALAQQIAAGGGGGGEGGGGVFDHGYLTGLADDDHPQYLTQARGDARYPRTDDPRLTDAREPTSHTHPAGQVTGLSPVATTGAYADLTGVPAIPDEPGDVGAAPAAHSHPVTDLTATGTASAATFLRGDGTWAAPPAGGDGGGVTDHSALTGRDAADQHPIGAVTGLAGALAGKVATDDPRLSDARTPTAHGHAAGDVTGLSAVATSGAYGDLTGRPALSPVATSGAYTDLTGTPTIPAAYTDEQARNAIVAMLDAGAHTGVTVTHDDAADSLSLATTGGSGGGSTVLRAGRTTDSGATAMSGTPVVDSSLRIPVPVGLYALEGNLIAYAESAGSVNYHRFGLGFLSTGTLSGHPWFGVKYNASLNTAPSRTFTPGLIVPSSSPVTAWESDNHYPYGNNQNPTVLVSLGGAVRVHVAGTLCVQLRYGNGPLPVGLRAGSWFSLAPIT
jgi:hypothetical protein